MNISQLIEEAIQARKHAYTPYSHFQVGAALLAASGKIYRGCNIENAGYTPSNCAERTAFFKAVSEGERVFEAIAVVAGPEGGELEETAPCGVCRQVMMEFCDYETFQIIMAVSPKDYQILTLKELLPMGFGPANLNCAK
ncbi:MAG: cytidine deaminase [Lachnospiraceae bacterium]|nr:cytidine deaminase [Lachnospiraceae bacterium]